MIPFDQVVKSGTRELLHKPIFIVNIDISRFCNYACSYCWPAAHSPVKDHRSPDLLMKALNEIKRQAKANGFQGFNFAFGGGEPTLHPGLLDILSDLQSDTETYQTIDVVTNMSQGPKWWCAFIDSTERFHNVSITASWHREAGLTDMEKYQKQFADKVFLLNAHHMTTDVNVVMVPAWWDDLFADAGSLYDRGLDVSLKMQEGGSPYSQEQLDLLSTAYPHRKWVRPPSNRPVHPLGAPLPDLGEIAYSELVDASGGVSYVDSSARLNSLGYNRYEGWSCNAGFQSVRIVEPEGKVYRAVACHDEPIGDIENGFELFSSPKVCITPCCSCLFDLKIPKSR